MAFQVDQNEAGIRSWEAAKAHPRTWCRITEAEADEALNVLPPIYFDGGFAVSEPIRHTAADEPVFLGVVQRSGIYYCAEGTVAELSREARKLRLG